MMQVAAIITAAAIIDLALYFTVIEAKFTAAFHVKFYLWVLSGVLAVAGGGIALATALRVAVYLYTGRDLNATPHREHVAYLVFYVTCALMGTAVVMSWRPA